MSKPPRDLSHTPTSTYFVTTNAFNGQALFQSERVVKLLLQTIFEYRNQKKYLLHEFVIMPNHVHLLFTVGCGVTLERAVQLIKGGFSYRAGKQLELKHEIWQRGYVDHRVRNSQDFYYHREYIRQNPVKAFLAEFPESFTYSSAYPSFALDEAPQGLKPIS